MPQTFPPPPTAGGTADPLVPPSGDNTGSIGAVGNRWADIYCVEAHVGDLNMRAPDGSAHWRFVEKPDHIKVYNVKTGETFRLALVPEESQS